MPLDAAVIARARKLNAAAVSRVLSEHYPAAQRMARALTGHEAASARVMRFILRASFKAMPRFRDEIACDRWFYHHTLLESRRQAPAKLDPKQDLIVFSSGSSEPQFVAFIRAMRQLPFQQREAFLLHHGEHLNERFLGVSMDCSTQAAAQHLHEANTQMQTLAGNRWDEFLNLLKLSYHNLTPATKTVDAILKSTVSRHLWPKRILRTARWLLMLGAIAALLWLVWHWRAMIESYLPK